MSLVEEIHEVKTSHDAVRPKVSRFLPKTDLDPNPMLPGQPSSGIWIDSRGNHHSLGSMDDAYVINALANLRRIKLGLIMGTKKMGPKLMMGWILRFERELWDRGNQLRS